MCIAKRHCPLAPHYSHQALHHVSVTNHARPTVMAVVPQVKLGDVGLRVFRSHHDFLSPLFRANMPIGNANECEYAGIARDPDSSYCHEGICGVDTVFCGRKSMYQSYL